jgi:excinuclease UvrABC helicase subunit UvrB
METNDMSKKELEELIKTVRDKKIKYVALNNYEIAACLRNEEKRLQEQLDNLNKN